MSKLYVSSVKVPDLLCGLTTEHFLIMQETALDFWRMVVEHNVATMVVLSSEGELWNYWPDELQETREFGYITVKHTAKENRVAYIKREFTVYNKKVTIMLV